MDPFPGIQAIQDAYALGQGADVSTIAPVQDIIRGTDLDGVTRVFGIVRNGRVSYRGTEVFSHLDLIEWLEDFLARLRTTPFGQMADGTWQLFGTLKTDSGCTLQTYNQGADGHSLGALLAAAHSASASCPLCAWACPKGLGADFQALLANLGPFFAQEVGDIIWRLGFGVLPSYGVLPLSPPGTGDLAYHHSLTTYAASYNAIQRSGISP
jgi:hypothetical protein